MNWYSTFDIKESQYTGTTEVRHNPCRDVVHVISLADAVEWADKHDCREPYV